MKASTMKRRHVPTARRRAPLRPRRGTGRGFDDPVTFGTDHGCVHISPAISETDYPLVMAAFEVHVKSGFGARSTSTGLMTSEMAMPRGTLVLSSDPSLREHYAYYSWEVTR